VLLYLSSIEGVVHDDDCRVLRVWKESLNKKRVAVERKGESSQP
jgi:hypothetical protein